MTAGGGRATAARVCLYFQLAEWAGTDTSTMARGATAEPNRSARVQAVHCDDVADSAVTRQPLLVVELLSLIIATLRSLITTLTVTRQWMAVEFLWVMIPTQSSLIIPSRVM